MIPKCFLLGILGPIAVRGWLYTEFVPGSNCGLGQEIISLDRDPTAAERAAGCIHVNKYVMPHASAEGKGAIKLS